MHPSAKHPGCIGDRGGEIAAIQASNRGPQVDFTPSPSPSPAVPHTRPAPVEGGPITIDRLPGDVFNCHRPHGYPSMSDFSAASSDCRSAR